MDIVEAPTRCTSSAGDVWESAKDKRSDQVTMLNPKKTVSSVASFGARLLTDESKMYDYNAWDQVEWTPEQESHALLQVQKQAGYAMPAEQQEKYEEEAAAFWDKFYQANEDKFFKQRNWLRVEFPELFEQVTRVDTSSRFNMLEIGCGTGSTVFPVLAETTRASNVFVYAVDFAPTAIELVQRNPEYDPERCLAFVYDVTCEELPSQIEEGSLDVCACIFVLSAIHPDQIRRAINNMYKLLKPGGLVVFRDYGRYDMTQLRFKPHRRIQDNFYVRGDGTRCYFFAEEEIRDIFKDFTIDSLKS
ncbi:hypothetical protein SeMB42_g00252 [Synchytrium endobioticum]|uniref:tRNA N(3)-methylcytidine methyltransferase n=1 Tax=Synchytrium endobioticum TaxID=286115 RepID=A0A507DTA4_9FUNG|nr:hypothetical protein SeMB42_g00252 [Synchytrium endobioticum]